MPSLGNRLRIGTEEAWIATMDTITRNRGDELLLPLVRAFESPFIAAQYTYPCGGLHRVGMSKKITHGCFGPRSPHERVCERTM